MKQHVLMAALALGATAAPVQGQAQLALQRPTIVLVHGGFVDGSGWQGVYKILRKDGYTVRVVQNPTISLAGDVATTRLIVDPQDGYLFLARAKFAASFAGDVNAETAAFMAESQVPWGVEALAGAITEPAWKTKPSWY